MCVCNHVLVNPMKMSTYCVEFNSCCCFLTVLLTMHKCMCVSFVLTHSLNLSTNCGLFHPQPKEFECNLSLSHSALSLLLLFITRSLAAAAPTRTALLRCSNQCLRILLRALSLFDTIRLVSALGSAPRRLTHGSLTVD